jgi:hypothetical protein
VPQPAVLWQAFRRAQAPFFPFTLRCRRKRAAYRKRKRIVVGRPLAGAIGGGQPLFGHAHGTPKATMAITRPLTVMDAANTKDRGLFPRKNRETNRALRVR